MILKGSDQPSDTGQHVVTKMVIWEDEGFSFKI